MKRLSENVRKMILNSHLVDVEDVPDKNSITLYLENDHREIYALEIESVENIDVNLLETED